MNPVLIGIMASLFYLISSTLRQFNLDHSRLNAKTLGSIAIALHGISIYPVILTQSGINLGFFPVLSLVAFTIALVLFIFSLKKPVDNLFSIVFGFAVFAIVLSLALPSEAPPRQYAAPMASHILLSILALGFFIVSALQAVLLAFQNTRLKKKQLAIKGLPPIQTIESLMFQMITIGMVLLTLSIITGFFFIEDFFAQHLAHKTSFALTSWVVFSVLLWGRYQQGWRGPTAVRWTLGGFALLMLAYFGVKLVLEFILQRF